MSKHPPQSFAPRPLENQPSMTGGAPILVPAADPEEKILCIADLEKAGSEKMEKGARG
jgi:hypothetical protein